MKEKIMLRSKAKKLSPAARIGKLGLSQNTLKEIKNLLKKRGLIKIKILPSYLAGKDRKDTVKEIVEKTQAELIESVGNVVVLFRGK